MKLLGARSLLQIARLTFKEAQAVFGVCQYASRILNTPLYEYYYVFKFMRRRNRLLASGLRAELDTVRIWPSISSIWDTWIVRLVAGYRAPVEQTTGIFHVVSDASQSGYGAIVFPPFSTPFAISGSWPPHVQNHHINQKELMALVIACTHIPQSSHIAIKLDNTTAIHCINKTRSRCYQLNGLVQSLLSSYVIKSVEYVASEHNIADGLSRGKQLVVTNELDHFGGDLQHP